MTRAAAAVAAVAVLALLAPGWGGDAEQVSTRRHTAASGGTAAVRRAPLTNLPDPHGVARRRSSLAVKIENTPEARPQSGLDVADVVYEEVVEGGITRFWAIFDSAAPDRVGPVRSVRRMDADIVSPLGGVVAYSGGTEPNLSLIRQAPVTWVDESNAAGAFVRDRSRDAPHNLYARTSRLWHRGGGPVPPASLFEFLPPRQSFRGAPARRVTIGFQPGYAATYSYNHATGTWRRSYGSVPFDAESGSQIAPVNVIVQFVRYDGAGGDGELLGTGDALVMSGGRLAKGRWSKSTASDPTHFRDDAGAPIRLRPGRTWVELLPVGSRVTVKP